MAAILGLASAAHGQGVGTFPPPASGVCAANADLQTLVCGSGASVSTTPPAAMPTQATAVGHAAHAFNTDTTAIGANSAATGTESSALGSGASAAGDQSIAAGSGAAATGERGGWRCAD